MRPTTELTKMESLVLEHLANGKATKETAYDLGISIGSVYSYRKRAKTKLRIRSTADLVRYVDGMARSMTPW